MMKRITWIQHNRPRGRDNTMFTEYKEAKRIFKKAQKKAISEINERYYDVVHGGNTLYIYLQRLFNMMIKCAYVPKDCKIGVIIPIHKYGKPKGAPKSYRPIT